MFKYLSNRDLFLKYKHFFMNKQEMYFRKDSKLEEGDTYINTKTFSSISNTAADLVIGDTPKFSVGTDNVKTNEFIEVLINNTNINATLKQAVREQSYRGCTLAKGRLIYKNNRLEPKLEFIDPYMLLIQTHPDDSTAIRAAQLRWAIYVTVDGKQKQYIRVETHYPNKIVNKLYEKEEGGKLVNEQPIVPFYLHYFNIKIDEEVNTYNEEILLEYIPNYRADNTDFEGISDYDGIVNIVKAFEILKSEANKSTHKNMNPVLVAPTNLAKKDKNGKHFLPKQDTWFIDQPMNMSQTKSGILVPAQIQIEVNTDLVQQQFEMLQNDLLVASELSPAAFGMIKDGSNVSSGKALKFRFYNPLQNAARKRDSLDYGLKRLIKNLMVTATLTPGSYWRGMEVDDISIDWGDGLPDSWDETVVTVMALYQNGSGIISGKEALRQAFPDWDEDKIEKVYTELQEEKEKELNGAVYSDILDESMGADVEEGEE